MGFMVSFHCKKYWVEILLLSMKTCMMSLLNSKGKSNHTHTLEQHVAWLKELLLKVWCRSTKTKLKPVHVLGNTFFLMSHYDLDELIRISPLMAY